MSTVLGFLGYLIMDVIWLVIYYAQYLLQTFFPTEWFDYFLGFLAAYLMFLVFGPPMWLFAYLLYFLEQ